MWPPLLGNIQQGRRYLQQGLLNRKLLQHRCVNFVQHLDKSSKSLTVSGETLNTDSWTNVTPGVLDRIGQNLHNKAHHPLHLIRLRIQNYFYSSFINRYGSPLFAVFDNISPVVSAYQNFDSLLVPANHPSRAQTDTYYINSECLLRSHTSAHQEELIRMGFDAFLLVGDVYRRDTIDRSHYPVFHQMEGVRLFTDSEIFSRVTDPTGMSIFDSGPNTKRSQDKQECHTMDAAKLIEYDLKSTLITLAQRLFGKDVEYRWVDEYFPFTHPSWELEVRFNGEWMEVLGCGVMEQKLLNNAGANQKIGWAFGLGLERLAMKLYSIPDIRLFWSNDSGFLSQFKVENPETAITYKPISMHPQCINDLSFWIPKNFSSSDFYDLVRLVGGDVVEQVSLVDVFTHPKHQRTSHCYRIVYRHNEKTFTNEEVNTIHTTISDAAATQLGVEVRNK